MYNFTYYIHVFNKHYTYDYITFCICAGTKICQKILPFLFQNGNFKRECGLLFFKTISS